MNLEKVANLAKIAKVNSIFHCDKKDTLSNIAYFCLKKQGKEGPLKLRKFQFRKNRKSNTNFPLQRKKHAKK